MNVANYAKLSAERLALIRETVRTHETLLEVMDSCLERRRTEGLDRVFDEIVAQDEFTVDLVVPFRDGLTLVYGAT